MFIKKYLTRVGGDNGVEFFGQTLNRAILVKDNPSPRVIVEIHKVSFSVADMPDLVMAYWMHKTIPALFGCVKRADKKQWVIIEHEDYPNLVIIDDEYINIIYFLSTLQLNVFLLLLS